MHVALQSADPGRTYRQTDRHCDNVTDEAWPVGLDFKLVHCQQDGSQFPQTKKSQQLKID